MQAPHSITVFSHHNRLILNVESILYVVMNGKKSEIHISGGTVYETRMTMQALEDALGDGFIKIHRGCLVAARAIHRVTDQIDLINGEHLQFARRKKSEIMDRFYACQRRMLQLPDGQAPASQAEYRRRYAGFDSLPVAFADLEMVWNEERRAVDWALRYGNQALARLERKALDQLQGSGRFSAIDGKWLRAFEQAVLYGDTLEVLGHSPELDTHLKLICFPTLPGHCGCLVFDLSDLRLVSSPACQNWL